MKYEERNELMKNLDPAQLAGGPTPLARAEGHFRWYILQLLADLCESVAGMSYAWREMLKISQAKAGLGNMDKSRYGGNTPAKQGDGK